MNGDRVVLEGSPARVGDDGQERVHILGPVGRELGHTGRSTIRAPAGQHFANGAAAHPDFRRRLSGRLRYRGIADDSGSPRRPRREDAPVQAHPDDDSHLVDDFLELPEVRITSSPVQGLAQHRVRPISSDGEGDIDDLLIAPALRELGLARLAGAVPVAAAGRIAVQNVGAAFLGQPEPVGGRTTRQVVAGRRRWLARVGARTTYAAQFLQRLLECREEGRLIGEDDQCIFPHLPRQFVIGQLLSPTVDGPEQHRDVPRGVLRGLPVGQAAGGLGEGSVGLFEQVERESGIARPRQIMRERRGEDRQIGCGGAGEITLRFGSRATESRRFRRDRRDGAGQPGIETEVGDRHQVAVDDRGPVSALRIEDFIEMPP
ncbi:hypothetical protein [Nocardia niwae]|uniref:Uncharacterized protein n=1 Tax=Nocardia niwae TaxID=626084 RepID=A0ABV2X395_9NOCA